MSIKTSEQINEISLALSIAQSDLDTAKKDNQGYGYNYSDLASVISTAKPILAKNKLAITQLIGEIIDGKVSLTTMLTHSSGQFFQSTGSFPIISMKGTNEVQNAGASLSYARRYMYQAILGMASEDNDASSNGFEKPSYKAKSDSPKESPKVESPKEDSPTSFRRTKPVTNGSDL